MSFASTWVPAKIDSVRQSLSIPTGNQADSPLYSFSIILPFLLNVPGPQHKVLSVYAHKDFLYPSWHTLPRLLSFSPDTSFSIPPTEDNKEGAVPCPPREARKESGLLSGNLLLLTKKTTRPYRPESFPSRPYQT